MKLIFAFLCLSVHCFGAVAFDNYAQGSYTGAGANSTAIVASGTNLAALMVVYYRSGSYNTSPAIGGQTGTKIASNLMSVCSGATVDLWIVQSGLSAGSLTATVNMTVESQIDVITVNGAQQTGQPDSLAALFTSTFTPIAGGSVATLPFTTTANNSLAIGVFCAVVGTTDTPSSNGTYIGIDSSFGSYYWRSTANVSPAGSFSLAAMASSVGTSTYNAHGISISPTPPPSTPTFVQIF